MTGKPVFSADVILFLVFSVNEDGQLYCHVRVWKLRQGEVTSPTQGCSNVKWLSQDGGPWCAVPNFSLIWHSGQRLAGTRN